MSKLAILGGPKTVATTPRKYRSMGAAEKQIVAEVMDSDCLSGFYGSWGDEFLGGIGLAAKAVPEVAVEP